MYYSVIATFILTAVIFATGCGARIQREKIATSGSLHNKNVLMTPTPTAEVNTTSSNVSTNDSTKNIMEQKMGETKAHRENDMEPEITAAIAQFKKPVPDRREAAKTLLPLLKVGMSVREVESMLGMPNAKVWDYTLFYSSALVIRFDKDDKIINVSSDLLDEVQLSGNIKDKTDPEITRAMSEFKGQPYSRQKPAKKLIPLLKEGLPMREVETLLGKSDGIFWEYNLSDSSSSTLVVHFSNAAKVEEITSTGLDEK